MQEECSSDSAVQTRADKPPGPQAGWESCPVCQPWREANPLIDFDDLDFDVLDCHEAAATGQARGRPPRVHRGKPLTPDHREKIRAASAGVKRGPLDPEHRACALC